MSLLFRPIEVVAAILAERVRHQQEKMIEFLHKELEVLREQMGDKRILLADDQRRVLAVKGMALDKEQLERTCIIVQPDTLRRWHRELVEGNRYKSGQREIGRPSTDHEIVDLVLRMVRENASWGYKRIEGALSNVGYDISSSTVANILKHHGIQPAPQRKHQLSWATFIRSHLDVFEGICLSAIFGMLVAWFSWRTIRDHILAIWLETEPPIKRTQPVTTEASSTYHFLELENVEQSDVSHSTTSVKSIQFTRGPPAPLDVSTRPSLKPFSEAA